MERALVCRRLMGCHARETMKTGGLPTIPSTRGVIRNGEPRRQWAENGPGNRSPPDRSRNGASWSRRRNRVSGTAGPRLSDTRADAVSSHVRRVGCHSPADCMRPRTGRQSRCIRREKLASLMQVVAGRAMIHRMLVERDEFTSLAQHDVEGELVFVRREML